MTHSQSLPAHTKQPQLPAPNVLPNVGRVSYWEHFAFLTNFTWIYSRVTRKVLVLNLFCDRPVSSTVVAGSLRFITHYRNVRYPSCSSLDRVWNAQIPLFPPCMRRGRLEIYPQAFVSVRNIRWQSRDAVRDGREMSCGFSRKNCSFRKSSDGGFSLPLCLLRKIYAQERPHRPCPRSRLCSDRA